MRRACSRKADAPGTMLPCCRTTLQVGMGLFSLPLAVRPSPQRPPAGPGLDSLPRVFACQEKGRLRALPPGCSRRGPPRRCVHGVPRTARLHMPFGYGAWPMRVLHRHIPLPPQAARSHPLLCRPSTGPRARLRFGNSGCWPRRCLGEGSRTQHLRDAHVQREEP
jgi:hypothetical protein